jgi:hypothetical protein
MPSGGRRRGGGLDRHGHGHRAGHQAVDRAADGGAEHRALLRCGEELPAQPGHRREAVRVADRRDAEQVEAEQDHDGAGEDLQHALRQARHAAGHQHGAEQRGDQADAGVDGDARGVIGGVGPRPLRLSFMKQPDTSPPHMPMQWPLPRMPTMKAAQ